MELWNQGTGVTAFEKLHEHGKFLPSFSVISKASHNNFMLCTALPLLSASIHKTRLAFLLAPALTCTFTVSQHEWISSLLQDLCNVL